MAHDIHPPRWHDYVAVTTAIIAVLAAISSFQASSNSSLMLEEKNNSILFQNKANKEWNNYLADDISRHVKGVSQVSQEQRDFQSKAQALEAESTQASSRFETYFQKNSHFVTSGTFLEIAIALSAMSTLLRKKIFWLFSLGIAGIGLYFLAIALV